MNILASNNTLPSFVEADDSLRPWKYVLMLVAFSTAMAGSYLPWRLTGTDPASATSLVRHGTCLAAGFIIGGGFLHAFPDAMQLFVEWRMATGNADTTPGVVDLGCTACCFFSCSQPPTRLTVPVSLYLLTDPWASLIAIVSLLLLIYIDRVAEAGGAGHAHGGMGHNVRRPTDIPSKRVFIVFSLLHVYRKVTPQCMTARCLLASKLHHRGMLAPMKPLLTALPTQRRLWCRRRSLPRQR